MILDAMSGFKKGDLFLMNNKLFELNNKITGSYPRLERKHLRVLVSERRLEFSCILYKLKPVPVFR